MKYLIVVSDSILDDVKERYPYIQEKPIVRPLFVDENGNSVYLSESNVKALQDAAAREAIEYVKKRHEMWKSEKIDSTYYSTDGICDILKESKKEE